jgi:O-antigen ligase
MLIIYNVNGVAGVFSGNLGILTPVLILMGFISVILLMKFIRPLIHQLIIKRLLVFMIGYLFFGLLFYPFFEGGYAFPIKLATDTLVRTMFIVLPFGSIGVMFGVIGRRDYYIKFMLFNMFFATMSIPIFKYLGISFEVLSMGFDSYNRYSGIWANANVAGFFAIATLVITYYSRIVNIIGLKLMILATFLLLYSIFLTSSTTAFIISIIISIIYVFVSSKGSNQFAKLITFGVSVMFILPLLIGYLSGVSKGNSNFEKGKISNMINILSGNFSEIESSGRGDMVVIAYDMIKEHWISGYGYGYFLVERFDGQGLHNYYLTILGEAGIFGFSALILFLLSFITLWIKNKEIEKRFILTSAFVYYSFTFGSGAGLIGNAGALIFCVTVSSVVSMDLYNKNY